MTILYPVPCVGLFSHTTKQFSNISWVFNSILTLPGNSIWFHRLRVQSHKPVPHFRCQLQVQVVTCASDQPAINFRFPRPPPLVWLICWSCSQNSGNKGYQKIQINSQIKRYTAQGPKQKSFCPGGVWRPAWWHMEVFWFTNLEGLQTPSFGGFMEAPLHRHDWLNHGLL